jgi:hypothetical protein
MAHKQGSLFLSPSVGRLTAHVVSSGNLGQFRFLSSMQHSLLPTGGIILNIAELCARRPVIRSERLSVRARPLLALLCTKIDLGGRPLIMSERLSVRACPSLAELCARLDFGGL